MGVEVDAPPAAGSSRLTADEVCREAFEAARLIDNEWALSRALRGMARRLPAGCVPEALRLVRAMQTPSLRGRTLMALTLCVPASDRPGLLSEASDAIAQIPAPVDQVRLLSALAAYLDDESAAEVAQRVLSYAPDLPDEWERGWQLVSVADYLPPQARLKALDRLRALEDAGARASMLADMAHFLPETVEDAVLDEAVETARGIEDEETRAAVLAGMLSRLPEETRIEAALEAVTAAARSDAMLWARVLRTAAAVLPPDARAQAVSQAMRLQPPDARAEALSALLTVAPELERSSLAAAAIDAASRVADEWTRATLISRLVPQLPPEQLSAALAAGGGIRDPWARADLLGDLSGVVPETERAGVLAEALAAARAAPSPWVRARALTGVAAAWPKQ